MPREDLTAWRNPIAPLFVQGPAIFAKSATRAAIVLCGSDSGSITVK
jgi:hypothetical protein